MEPLSFLFNLAAAAVLTAFPTAPATVHGTVETTYVSNSSAISETALQLKTPDKATSDKAAAEAAAKAAEAAKNAAANATDAAKAETAKTAEKEHLHLPLEAGKYAYTSDYGLRCAPVTGAGNFHYGIDLAAPEGTPMYSIADGTVTAVVDGVMGSQQGGDVRIESTINGKLMTLRYYHMGNSSQYLKVGDQVKAGQHISDVGMTGMATGPHLHFEVLEGHFSENKHIDPEEYFKEIGFDVIGKAYANYVNKADHPASCPGGISSEEPATPTAPILAASATNPSNPANVPASPAPAAPAPAPAPVAPAPKHAAPVTPAPSPAPTNAPPVKPSPVPVPVATIPTASSAPKELMTVPATIGISVP